MVESGLGSQEKNGSSGSKHWYTYNSNYLQELKKRPEDVLLEVRSILTQYYKQNKNKEPGTSPKYGTVQMIQTIIKDEDNFRKFAFEKCSQLELTYNQWKKSINQLQKQNSQIKQQIQQLQRINQQFKIENQQLKRKIIENQTKFQNILNQINQWKKSITQLQKQNSQIKQQIQQLQRINQQFKIENQQLKSYSKGLQNSSTQSTLNPQENKFLGQILHEEYDYKNYVIKILEKATKTHLVGGRVLYRMDLLNQTNFHRYFDNHPNLLVVIKLMNGFMLAVFHEDAIFDKMNSKKMGIIFSLTNFCCFRNIKTAVSYDFAHLLYGNSQIRIMTGKNKIFSNFGVNNGYYERNGQTVDILLGEGQKRQVQMETYEILQLHFK